MLGEEMNLNKPFDTFVRGVTLSVLEYILEAGVEDAIVRVADTPAEDLRVFPHVKEEVRKYNLLQEKERQL